jgi:hypothetical protein
MHSGTKHPRHILNTLKFILFVDLPKDLWNSMKLTAATEENSWKLEANSRIQTERNRWQFLTENPRNSRILSIECPRVTCAELNKQELNKQEQSTA